MKTTLPVDSDERKGIPLLSGCLRYIPAAIAGMARWSKLGNDKHNPGEPLHHARGKSMDHGDCIVRHLLDIQDIMAAYERGPEKINVQQLMDECDALFWRAGVLSQELHERFAGAPLAPGAKLPTQTADTYMIRGSGGGGYHSGEIAYGAGGGNGNSSAGRTPTAYVGTGIRPPDINGN